MTFKQNDKKICFPDKIVIQNRFIFEQKKNENEMKKQNKKQ